MCFPLIIWLIEIVEGYLLLFLYGENIAWFYTGSYVYLHQNIKLNYGFLWMGAGLILDPFYFQILEKYINY